MATLRRIVNKLSMDALALLSGGIDSACCVSFYRESGHEVTGVFVDYGQPVSQREQQSAKAIAHHYSIPLHVIRCSPPSSGLTGEIAGRNAFLIFVALLHFPRFVGILTLGIHAGTDYYDCSEHFASHANSILSGYSNGKLVLATPFLHWSKHAVYDFCLKSRVPVKLTWSCEVGPAAPCGCCLSCEDRRYLSVRSTQ